MPSHIFLALGMWPETAASNEAAWAVSVDRAKRQNLGVDDRNHHALYWLEYAYLQQGRVADARRLLAEMEADAKKSGSAPAKNYLARMRAAAIVDAGILPAERTGSASGLAGVGESLARGLAAWKREDFDSMRRALEEMGTPGAPEAGHSHGSSSASARGGRGAGDVMRQELRGVMALASGNAEHGVAELKAATEAEDRLTFEFGPPEIVKPSHELLGEVLLQAGRSREAAAEFQKSLARAPGQALSLHGLAEAARRSGDGEVASRAEGEYRQIRRRADPPPSSGR
jgi:tetratricopeptide (TPR) repeat protein